MSGWDAAPQPRYRRVGVAAYVAAVVSLAGGALAIASPERGMSGMLLSGVALSLAAVAVAAVCVWHGIRYAHERGRNVAWLTILLLPLLALVPLFARLTGPS